MSDVNLLTPSDLHSSIKRNPDGQSPDLWGVDVTKLVDTSAQGNMLTEQDGKLTVNPESVVNGLRGDDTKVVTLKNASGKTVLGLALASA